MAITSARMQVRRGLEADFDPEKMHQGEWSLSTDTKYIRMCIDPGTCLRMATYEAFEEDMERIEVIYADFKDAELDIEIAETSANLSESYAIGGTGTREGEDTDNAKYYSEKAKESADKLDTMTVDVLTKQLGEWEQCSIPTTQTLYAVTYENGMFVAGGSGVVYYSVDGINWTAGSGLTSDILHSIAYGNGMFVGVTNVRYTYRSFDGINWIKSPQIPTYKLRSVTYGNGMFVAVGEKIAYYSTDGINWTAGNGTITHNLVHVIYKNGFFIAAGGGKGGIYHSTDGINWTVGIELPGTTGMNEITYGNGMFVGVGSNGTIYCSTDGINWFVGNETITKILYTVSYGNGIFVAGGYDGEVYYSKDGVNWSVDNTQVSSNPLQMIAYGNGMFVAVGNGGNIHHVEFLKETTNITESIKDLYSKVNRMPYALVPILSTNWTASTEYTGYGYEFVQAIEDYYDTFPEWFLKPLSGIVPTEAEQTAFENIAAMKLDISDTSSPKLKFYAATQPTTDILVLVKGVQ